MPWFVREKFNVAENLLTGPVAQLGTQLSWFQVPAPAAWELVQVDHLMPVTVLAPSALKSMTVGLRPVNDPIETLGVW